ncbi:MAG: P-loop NTPase [Nitrososphaerota archaeon]|nr:P-loop NTPase [Nitrososphaerota archaeon]
MQASQLAPASGVLLRVAQIDNLKPWDRRIILIQVFIQLIPDSSSAISMVTREEVLKALSMIRDPETGRDLVSSGFVKQVKLSDESVEVLLVPRNPTPERIDLFRREVSGALGGKGAKVSVDFTVAPQGQFKLTGLEKIKNVVAVASGKGGVGKSTVAIYTALALAERGKKVGLLDADIYGASAHLMLKSSEPMASHDNRIIPPTVRGVKMMSMGYFTQTENPVIWRGPLVGKAVRDFIELTEWGELDFLVVDLPPGCVAEGTRVLASDGKFIPVERLSQGSRVVSFDGKEFVAEEVEGVISQGRLNAYQLKAGGRSVTATGNHPFLIREGEKFGWKRLDQVIKGERLVGVSTRSLDSGMTGQTIVSECVVMQDFEVESVETVGPKETYDVTVSNYHNFVAEGFIVHNTGDAPLTLAQTLPVSGVILVTTPQEAASRVAAKSYYMFKKLEIPIIGVVENMSYFQCPHCGQRSNIFGEGGGKKLAGELGVEFLGEVPLMPSLTASGDTGIPLDPGEITPSFKSLAEKLVSREESLRE